MKITLERVVKRFGSTVVVKGANLTIEDGEMFFLLGPSGCGKTTILRMLAGFYDPDEGRILFWEKNVIGTPPHERNTALVFQNYAVWPHMSVFENVAYGLRVRKVKEPELSRRVNQALEQVKMLHLAHRKPSQLSGGQQQRVALARAIVVDPDLLLFDEPLSNLDAKLRIEMRDQIKRLHSETKKTSLYVTHDQEEALSLATRIAVMNNGVIQQTGTPQEVYTKPANAFVASFIGEMNFIKGTSQLGRQIPIAPDKKAGIRPENVAVSLIGDLPFKGKVSISTYLGSKNEITITTPSGEELRAWSPTFIPEGTEITFSLPWEHIHLFPIDDPVAKL